MARLHQECERTTDDCLVSKTISSIFKVCFVFLLEGGDDGDEVPQIDAYELLECIAKISGTEDRLQRMTPEGHEVLDEQIAEEVREVAKRGPFRFSACGIPVGSELVFVDDDSIRVTVVATGLGDDNKGKSPADDILNSISGNAEGDDEFITVFDMINK